MSHFIKLMLSSINGFVTPKSDGIVKVETDESSESQWKVLQLPDQGGKQYHLSASIKYRTRFTYMDSSARLHICQVVRAGTTGLLIL